jgi:hypothetical protein
MAEKQEFGYVRVESIHDIESMVAHPLDIVEWEFRFIIYKLKDRLLRGETVDLSTFKFNVTKDSFGYNFDMRVRGA